MNLWKVQRMNLKRNSYDKPPWPWIIQQENKNNLPRPPYYNVPEISITPSTRLITLIYRT